MTEERRDSINRCLNDLIHASTCWDSECKVDSCPKLKRVAAHIRVCKKRAQMSCPVCKKFIAMCCYHSSICQQDGCPVPYCMNLRMRWATLPPAAA